MFHGLKVWKIIAYLASSFFLFVVWSVAESFCLELLKFFWALFGLRLPAFGLRMAPLITRLLFRRLLLGILPPFPRPIYNVSTTFSRREEWMEPCSHGRSCTFLWRLASMMSCDSRHRFEIQDIFIMQFFFVAQEWREIFFIIFFRIHCVKATNITIGMRR